MNKVEAFGCEWCGMTSRTKGNVKRHEENFCRKNPNRKKCGNCKNAQFDETGYFCDEIEDFLYISINANTDCKYFENENQPKTKKQ